MKKPKNIDQDAEWKFDSWHKGKLSRNGKPKGRYSIWDEGGTLTDDGLNAVRALVNDDKTPIG